NPVAHCWSEQTHHKRKFCNVCRKRLDDSLSIHCEVCEYYVHTDCQDFAVAECKENATYVPDKELSSVHHQHHWREGNLPGNSKCAVCKKTCWSAECLAGFRCEWCGITSHAACHKQITGECTFGNLEPIYLPPHAVSIPRTEVPMEAIIGVQVRRRETMSREYSCRNLTFAEFCHFAGCDDSGSRVSAVMKRLSLVLPRSCKGNCHTSPPYMRARSISEEFSSGDTRYRESDDYLHTRDKGKEKEDRDEGKIEMIKVYDGNGSFRRHIFRLICVSRQSTTEELLTAALREFRITKDLGSFYLTDVYASEVSRLGEVCVADPLPVMSLHCKEGRRPAVFLRFRDRDNDSGEVRVYPGKLQVSEAYCTVPVNGETTAADLIREALICFGLENFKCEEYRLSEVLLDRGGTFEHSTLSLPVSTNPSYSFLWATISN
ncbi:hypothetical protein Cfor_03863, partial [Coptotermes formosanus]